MKKQVRPAEVEARLQRLGRVIRESRGEMPQVELGESLGVPQSTVSRWERGLVALSVEQLRAIEECLGVSPGTLAKRAGYVVDTVDPLALSLEDLVLQHTSIHPDFRGDAAASIRAYVALSRRAAAMDARGTSPRRRAEALVGR